MSPAQTAVVWLGRYVIMVALLEIVLHVAGFFSQRASDIAFGLNQHFWLMIFAMGSDGLAHGVSIAAAVAVLAAGTAMLEQRTVPSARTFLRLESILTAPSLFLFVIVLFAGLSSSHGMSVGEIGMPFVAALITSVVPCLAAYWVIRRFGGDARTLGLEHPIPTTGSGTIRRP